MPKSVTRSFMASGGCGHALPRLPGTAPPVEAEALPFAAAYLYGRPGRSGPGTRMNSRCRSSMRPRFWRIYDGHQVHGAKSRALGAARPFSAHLRKIRNFLQLCHAAIMHTSITAPYPCTVWRMRKAAACAGCTAPKSHNRMGTWQSGLMVVGSVLMVLLASCDSHSVDPGGEAIVERLDITLNPSGYVPLAAEFALETTQPVQVEVYIAGRNSVAADVQQVADDGDGDRHQA